MERPYPKGRKGSFKKGIKETAQTLHDQHGQACGGPVNLTVSPSMPPVRLSIYRGTLLGAESPA